VCRPLRHPFTFRRRLDENPRAAARGQHRGEPVPRRLNRPLDELPFLSHDADLAFPFVQVDANMIHG
jgi:hypothetical protein